MVRLSTQEGKGSWIIEVDPVGSRKAGGSGGVVTGQSDSGPRAKEGTETQLHLQPLEGTPCQHLDFDPRSVPWLQHQTVVATRRWVAKTTDIYSFIILETRNPTTKYWPGRSLPSKDSVDPLPASRGFGHPWAYRHATPVSASVAQSPLLP